MKPSCRGRVHSIIRFYDSRMLTQGRGGGSIFPSLGECIGGRELLSYDTGIDVDCIYTHDQLMILSRGVRLP